MSETSKNKAIYLLHPSVVTIRDDVAYDADGNQVSYDATAVDTRAALEALRQVRDVMLSDTDWWASSDLTMTTEQTTYRQALRDITDTYSSLDTVVWPTKP
tara:strand:+ start:453 stop:755 length:303 start_codon:yes stop_codon:yes gene_type:complete